jgi:hypothetical protein
MGATANRFQNSTMPEHEMTDRPYDPGYPAPWFLEPHLTRDPGISHEVTSNAQKSR